MTQGLNPAEEPRSTEAPEGHGFIKQWRVNSESKDAVRMPKDQTFIIKKVIEPDRAYFMIEPTDEESEIALDWTKAEFVLTEGKLWYHFKKNVDWTITLESGARSCLKATGNKRDSREEPGEWDANEEDGP